MPRTPEQIAADEALTQAIEKVWAAYDDEIPDGSVITDYVLVAARQWWDDDGDPCTAVMLTPRDGDMPYYRIMGLLDHALSRQRAHVASDD